MVEVRSIMKDTVFADGIPRIRPLLIFHGKGLRIKTAKRSNEIKQLLFNFKSYAFLDTEKLGQLFQQSTNAKFRWQVTYYRYSSRPTDTSGKNI